MDIQIVFTIILLSVIYLLCLKKWKLATVLFLVGTAWTLITFNLILQFVGGFFGATLYLFNSERITNLIMRAWPSISVLVIILNVGMVLIVSYFYKQDT